MRFGAQVVHPPAQRHGGDTSTVPLPAVARTSIVTQVGRTDLPLRKSCQVSFAEVMPAIASLSSCWLTSRIWVARDQLCPKGSTTIP